MTCTYGHCTRFLLYRSLLLRARPRLPTPHIQPAGQPLQYELMPTRNPAYQLHDPLAEKHRGDEVGLCENEVEVYESIPYQ